MNEEHALKNASDAYERGDYEHAYRQLHLLANRGNAEAQYRLGVMYETGEGVDWDDYEARKWYLKAAEQGLPKAQYRLSQSIEGVEGRNWFLQALDRRYVCRGTRCRGRQR